MLMNTIDLVQEARSQGVAIGAFNTYNLEITRAIVAAAENLRQPVILQLGVQAIKASGEPLVMATLVAARVAQAPVAVHLDHCPDLDLIEACFAWGLSSALADGSHLPFTENVAFTRRAVELAARYGGTIEAELGYLAGTEDGITVEAMASSLTDPTQAHQFVAETGAAMLAVSIGNVHGYTPTPPPLDFARLAQIAAQVEVPLVLHGASGIAQEDIQRAIRMGIAKLNVNTEVRTAFLRAIARWGVRVGTQPDLRKKGQDFLDLMQEAIAAAEEVVADTMRICHFMSFPSHIRGASRKERYD
jgi:tagatose 1,6-diphosphate aldolase GatY/KbaY